MRESPHGDDPRQLLATRRPFKELPNALLDQLARGARVLHLQRGEHLFDMGHRPAHLFLILRGLLQLRRTTAREEHALMALFGPGDVPAVPVLLKGGSYGADALAVTTGCSVLRVPAAPLLERLDTDVGVAKVFNRALLDHCRALHEKVDILSAGNVEQRLAKLFAVLCERYGDELEGGTHCVPVALTRADLASFVAARTETVIRTLSSWQKRGLVSSTSTGFDVPDPKALLALLRA